MYQYCLFAICVSTLYFCLPPMAMAQESEADDAAENETGEETTGDAFDASSTDGGASDDAAATPDDGDQTANADGTAENGEAGGGEGESVGFQRSGRMEFDERLVKGQAAKSGAVYLFQRTPRRLPGLVPFRRSYRERIVEPVLGRRELKLPIYSTESPKEEEAEVAAKEKETEAAIREKEAETEEQIKESKGKGKNVVDKPEEAQSDDENETENDNAGAKGKKKGRWKKTKKSAARGGKK